MVMSLKQRNRECWEMKENSKCRCSVFAPGGHSDRCSAEVTYRWSRFKLTRARSPLSAPKKGHFDIYNSMTTGQTPLAIEDHWIRWKAPEQRSTLFGQQLFSVALKHANIAQKCV